MGKSVFKKLILLMNYFLKRIVFISGYMSVKTVDLKSTCSLVVELTDGHQDKNFCFAAGFNRMLWIY